MKTLSNTLFMVFAIIFMLSSCSVKKRSYMKGYYVDWHKSKQGTNTLVHKKETKKIETVRNDEPKLNVIMSSNEVITVSLDNAVQLRPTAFRFYDGECGDNIILKNGDEIAAKVVEITEDAIKYKKCDNIDGPTHSVKKEVVLMIKYSNGAKDVFNISQTNNNLTQNYSNTPSQSNNPTEKEYNGFAVAGFILALCGLSIFALIFGIIAINQIDKHSNKYKGAGLAYAAVVLSILVLFIVVIILTL